QRTAGSNRAGSWLDQAGWPRTGTPPVVGVSSRTPRATTASGRGLGPGALRCSPVVSSPGGGFDHGRKCHQPARSQARNLFRTVASGLLVCSSRAGRPMATRPGEGAKFCLQICTELCNRGVAGVLMAVCDGLKGLPEAIEAVLVTEDGESSANSGL